MIHGVFLLLPPGLVAWAEFNAKTLGAPVGSQPFDAVNSAR
jgi:hypothetical protein